MPPTNHGHRGASAAPPDALVAAAKQEGQLTVIALPHDPGMYPPAIEAFPIVVGQGARMMIAGLISYGTSQTLNVLIFSKLAGGGEGKMVWLRGMIAGVISQVVDTVLFITISFYGERPIWDLMMGQMLTKIILSIVVVPAFIIMFVEIGRSLDGTRSRNGAAE